MKSLLIFSTLCCLVFASVVVTPVKSTAQNAIAPALAVAPVPVATVRYRVIDTSTIPLASGKNAAESIELMLNDMSSQGWRLVSISGGLFVLSAP